MMLFCVDGIIMSIYVELGIVWSSQFVLWSLVSDQNIYAQYVLIILVVTWSCLFYERLICDLLNKIRE